MTTLLVILGVLGALWFLGMIVETIEVTRGKKR